MTDPVEIKPSGVGFYDFLCAGSPAAGGTGGEIMTENQHTPRPPVEEPPNRPGEPPLPDEPPVEEPPQDPDREPPEPPVRARRQAASSAGCCRESDLI